jgi:uncharacterized protein (AIM24 family)
VLDAAGADVAAKTVPHSSLKTAGGMKRTLGGMPHIVTVANGPGRVAVQSVYQPPEDTEVIQNSSYATHHRW